MITNFLDFIDKRSIVRRAVLGVTVWMTWKSFAWASTFASATTLNGTEGGLMIAAVTAPIAALQAFTFKWYSDSRAE